MSAPWHSTIGGRMFLLAVSGVALVTVLLVTGQVTGQDWVDSFKWALGLFGVERGADRWKNGQPDYYKPGPAPEGEGE